MGYSDATIDARVDLEAGELSGAYETLLATYGGQPSLWSTSKLQFIFHPLYTAENVARKVYTINNFEITNRKFSETLVSAGARVNQDHSYCFSELTVGFKSNAGPFYGPSLTGQGDLVGTDSKGLPADYSVRITQGEGVTNFERAIATEGYVRLCLPQGKYNLTPRIRTSAGATTELLPMTVTLGCNQIINLHTSLRVGLDGYPREVHKAINTLSGHVDGTNPITRIEFSLNGAAPVEVCTNCGMNPTFKTDANLTPGENRFGFRAFDTDGKAASVDGVILYTPNPVTLNGCADIEKRIEYGQTEAPADFTVIANDGCGGAQVFCSHESGSLFPLGTSQVTCGASDTCGSSAECSFKVNVVAGAAPTATATSTSIATATPTSPATATPTPVNTLTPEPRPASQPVSCASDQVRVQVTCGIATPVLLWSPNHKFEDVGHTAAASASCEGAEPASPPAASLTGTTVWADEPEVSVPGDGSGNFAPDTRISGSIISVRSERRGTEDGRVYLLISHGSDGVGHESRACCTVVVPHSKSSASIALVNAQAAAARATCEQTGAAPSGFFQHGLSRSINRSGNESETSSGVDAKDRNQKGVKKPGKRDRRLI